MAVNANTWKRFPVAQRDQSFNADNAIKRIQQYSAGSVEAFNAAFLWRNSNGPPNNKNSYRLPIADVINGKLTLIPHAVFTAAAILSGAHGGLEGVVGEEEKKQLRNVVTAIYKVLRDMFGDPRVVAPWERDDTPPSERPNRQISTTAAVNGLVASLPMADESHGWDMEAARRRLWQWADSDFRKYRKGFLWWDHERPDIKSSYKLPVADVVEGKLVLVPRAVNAVAAVLAGARSSVDIPDSDMGEVGAVVSEIQNRFGDGKDGGDDSMTAAGLPLRPPMEWFADPHFDGPTRISVTADGRVQGHLAEWNVCHFGIREVCRMAPRSQTGYKYFMDGTVLTAGGEVPVGKITVGTGHADLRLGYVPAADHYDNTGNAVAVVAAGEDAFGIWVSGALTVDADERKVAALRRSPLSGDWRPTPYGLELVAALAVNSPGFPVVGFTASGDVQSLVAAGMLLTDDEIAALGPAEPSGPDRELLERLAAFNDKAAKLTKQAQGRRLDSILKRMGGVPDGM